jgi:predicted metalloprotease with PDZ domain
MRALVLPVLAVLALPATGAVSTAAQTDSRATAAPAEPIEYLVAFPAPHTHYGEITASVPAAGRAQLELMMPVWTPGSYLVREFARHVEDVRASTPEGRPLTVEKTEKNRWRVATSGAPRVVVRYRVYGREMSVRTNWIDAGFALLNGAPTFLTLADEGPRPHVVTIAPAAGWQRTFTGLTPLDGAPHRYRAADFDELVDSPILIGNAAVYEFTVDGVPHYLVNEGEGGVFDGAAAARDLAAIVGEARRLWGSFPYDRYLFLNVITEASGGLEHANSTVLMTSRWTTRSRRAYLGWLELAAHEIFHAWNAKRLRPVELGPFDYESEALTRSLWMVEGITDYYADLLVHRAGLSTQQDLLLALSQKIDELQTTPGRQVQSAELASFDAWIRYYRPDENSANVSISYYTKGAVLGFLLDARIRQLTDGRSSLDDVMRLAYARYAGPQGYTPDEFRAVAEEVAGASLADFWARAVQATGELDYSEALDLYGLRFRPGGPGGRAYLGISTRNDGGRLVITQVRRDTPAYGAGFNVDDEILAVDEFRVRADRFEGRLDVYRPGDAVSVLVARREQLMRIPVTFGSEPGRAWMLETSATAPPRAVQARGRWLEGS